MPAPMTMTSGCSNGISTVCASSVSPESAAATAFLIASLVTVAPETPSTSALCAIARMCSTVFVDPPIATSIVIAFSNACLVAIERGSTDSSSCW